MASYRIEWKTSASKELRKLSKPAIIKIIGSVEKLANNPFAKGVRKLRGSDHTYRKRVGNYRIIFSVYADELVIIVTAIGHRKNIYKKK